MDYKIIIILLVLLVLIILIYREISTLKDQVDKTIMTTTVATKQLNDRYETTIQHNMDKYISQIKTIGTENLQQLKKITLLNHQPIIQKKTSNHFTETDGSEMKSNYQQSFEEKKNKIFDHQNSPYYMSEETKKTKNSQHSGNISRNAEQSPNAKGYYNNMTNSSGHNKHNNDVASYSIDDEYSSSGESIAHDSTHDSTHDDITHDLLPENYEMEQFNNFMLNAKRFGDTIGNVILTGTPGGISFIKTDDGCPFNIGINNVQDQINHSINAFENVFNNASIPLFTGQYPINSGFVVEMDSDDKSNLDARSVDSISSESVHITQNIPQSIPQVGGNEMINIKELLSTELATNTNTVTVQDNGPINEKPLNEEPSVVEPSVVEPSVVEPINEEPSVVEPLNAETSVIEPLNAEPLNMEPLIVEYANKSIKQSTNKLPSIIIDTDIVDVETSQLKTVDEYTLNELKTLAKNLLIPTTYRHQNKTKQYKKDDLYNNIKIKYNII
jgi:hypothetical protein